eukprot:jgi/Psemu1/36673/gm1.36673_g
MAARLLQSRKRHKATTDATFLLDDGKEYIVHRILLSARARALFERLAEHDEDVRIPVSGVPSDVFEAILDYIHTDRGPEINDEARAREFLRASDRFGCDDLKRRTESLLVNKILRPHNAANLLVLANSHSCVRLRNAALRQLAGGAGYPNNGLVGTYTESSKTSSEERLDLAVTGCG